jgi:hypothetical protein
MSISTLRTQRDSLLKASDFLMLPDVLATTAEKEAAIAYRLILRDLISGDMTDETAADTELPVADAVIAGKLS